MFLADHDLSTSNETESYRRKIVRVVNFPTWMPGVIGASKGDLALLEVDQQLGFSETLGPICLPEPSQTFDNNEAEAAGWGITETGKASTVLKKVRYYHKVKLKKTKRN